MVLYEIPFFIYLYAINKKLTPYTWVLLPQKDM